jgi:hypothetical protein
VIDSDIDFNVLAKRARHQEHPFKVIEAELKRPTTNNLTPASPWFKNNIDAEAIEFVRISLMMNDLSDERAIHMPVEANKNLLPAAVRKQCRMIEFPEPTTNHFSIIAGSIVNAIWHGRSIERTWLSDLDQIEIDALADVWPGG